MGSLLPHHFTFVVIIYLIKFCSVKLKKVGLNSQKPPPPPPVRFVTEVMWMEIVFLFFSFLSWKVTICFKELVRVLPELLKLLGASSLGDLQHTVLLTQGPALSMVTISLVWTSLKRGWGGEDGAQTCSLGDSQSDWTFRCSR